MIKFRSPHELSGLGASEPILLALSGGADSSALLELLAAYCRECGAMLYAAHVDHKIRPGEHERDRRFCEALAKKYGVKLFTLEADLPKIAAESGESLETAARRVRYRFFAEIMAENGIKILATAHNADDNLETMIFNLARGAGLRGTCGIPPVRSFEGGFIVRPILEAEKAEILEFCRERALEFVTDSTNADDSYSRNRIRLRVISELRRINPAAARSATRFSASAALDLDFIEKSAAELVESDGSVKLSSLLSAHPALSRHALSIAFSRVSDASLEGVHIDALLELCNGGKGFSSISLPGNLCARIENRYLRFLPDKIEKNEVGFPEIKLSAGKNTLDRHILLYVECEKGKNIYKSATRMSIASAKIKGGLVARPRRAGDRILQNGMHKDLRKLMNEKKIPPELRSSLPVVLDDEGIIWVPYIGARDGLGRPNNESSFVTLSFEVGDAARE